MLFEEQSNTSRLYRIEIEVTMSRECDNHTSQTESWQQETERPKHKQNVCIYDLPNYLIDFYDNELAIRNIL